MSFTKINHYEKEYAGHSLTKTRPDSQPKVETNP